MTAVWVGVKLVKELHRREKETEGEGLRGKTKHRTRDTAGNLVRGHSQ